MGARRKRPSKIEGALEQHSAGASPGFLLWHATLRWQRHVTAALQEVGLTHVQFLVIGSCWWLGGKDSVPSQREIARHAGLDQAMTSQVIRALEREGLVLRTRDAADARVYRVETTGAGRALARRSVAIMDELDAAFFAAVGPVDQLFHQLRILGGRGHGGGLDSSGAPSSA